MDQKMQIMLSRMMDEKYTFTYKKLVVPMSMRSIYWKYFGFPATDEGDILTRVKIVCILCKTQIAYNRNTSNLRMHLQNKHAQELLELESSAPPRPLHLDSKTVKHGPRKPKTPKGVPRIISTGADGTLQVEGEVQFLNSSNINIQNIEDDGSGGQNVRVVVKGKNPSLGTQNVAIIVPEENEYSQINSMVDGKVLSDAIAEFVILDLQLPDVVEGQGFQRLVATLCSPCEIPDKTKLEEEMIPKIYDAFKENMMSMITSLHGELALSMEEWQLASGESFITVSAHFQQNTETMLETKVLSTLHCVSDMDSDQWGGVFDSFFSEWNIRLDRVTAVVTATSRKEVLSALSEKGLILVPCLLYSLQKCTTVCFNQPEVVSILQKCRAIIKLISQNAAAAATLQLQEQVLQMEENSLKMDYPHLWLTTYVMLEQLQSRKDFLTSVLQTIDNLQIESYTLGDLEWMLVEDLLTVLEPFKVTIMSLSEEKTPLVSLLKPLVMHLRKSHLNAVVEDSESTRNFKILLTEHLISSYSDPAVNQLLQTAMTLDPRFKLMPYAEDEEKPVSMDPIKQLLVKMVEDRKPNEGLNLPPNKKSRLSGMELLLGDLCTSQSGISAEERANLELVQYQSDNTARMDGCPLQWWARTAAKCPNLARLARKYNCVPVTVQPPHRFIMENQLVFEMRRACLGSHLVDKLLFLHGNHSV